MFFLVVTFSFVRFSPTFRGRIKNVLLSSQTLVFCFTARFYRDFDSIYTARRIRGRRRRKGASRATHRRREGSREQQRVRSGPVDTDTHKKGKVFAGANS